MEFGSTSHMFTILILLDTPMFLLNIRLSKLVIANLQTTLESLGNMKSQVRIKKKDKGYNWIYKSLHQTDAFHLGCTRLGLCVMDNGIDDRGPRCEWSASVNIITNVQYLNLLML